MFVSSRCSVFFYRLGRHSSWLDAVPSSPSSRTQDVRKVHWSCWDRRKTRVMSVRLLALVSLVVRWASGWCWPTLVWFFDCKERLPLSDVRARFDTHPCGSLFLSQVGWLLFSRRYADGGAGGGNLDGIEAAYARWRVLLHVNKKAEVVSAMTTMLLCVRIDDGCVAHMNARWSARFLSLCRLKMFCVANQIACVS